MTKQYPPMALKVGARVDDRLSAVRRYGNVIHLGSPELGRYLVHWDDGTHSWRDEYQLTHVADHVGREAK